MKLLDIIGWQSSVVAMEAKALDAFLRRSEALAVDDSVIAKAESLADGMDAEEATAYIVGARKRGTDMVIPIHGGMMKRVPPKLACLLRYFEFPFCSTLDVRDVVVAADADPSIDRLVFDIDSGGGSVDGLAELASAIRSCSKTTVAIVDSFMCSAALYQGVQCDLVYASHSAAIGSIGTRVMLIDDSKFWDELGVRFVHVDTGPHKSTGGPGKPITAEQIEPFQVMVDGLRDQFVEAIVQGRGDRITSERVEASATGQYWLAAEMQAMGFIDVVVTDPYAAAEAGRSETPAGSSPATTTSTPEDHPMLTIDKVGELTNKHPQHAATIVNLAKAGKTEDQVLAAISESDAKAERDAIVKERDDAKADAATARKEAEDAKAAQTKAEQERDEARAERDEARAERDELAALKTGSASDPGNGDQPPAGGRDENTITRSEYRKAIDEGDTETQAAVAKGKLKLIDDPK